MRSLVSPCASLVRRCKIAIPHTKVHVQRSICSYNTLAHTTSSSMNSVLMSGLMSGGLTSYGITTKIPHDIVPFHTQFPLIPKYPREIVFLIGAPGAGKGTHSAHIGQQRNFTAPTIVVSDLLNTPACRLMKDHGIMVDDDFVFNVLLTELQKPIYRNGVVVDGFPRTATQAKWLTKFYNDQCDLSLLNTPPCILFVLLHVDESLSIKRQVDRGQKIVVLNQQQKALGKPLLEVRQTDIDLNASKARYQVFEVQSQAVLALSHIFPLVIVEAGGDIQSVRGILDEKMQAFPSVL